MIATNTVRPFIIWTLQRTGGTNLAQRLTERSGLPGTQHEPFNHGRIFGYITEQWIKDRNVEQLERAVGEICQRGVIIKHCVETVPWEVTEALAQASCKAGYRHLFLYRRNALDRLLSLHFAQKTGVWGPDMLHSIAVTGAGEADPSDTLSALREEALAAAVPVDKLVNHENYCVQTLSRTWHVLQTQGAQPQVIAYEDIYRASNPEQPVSILLPVLQYLGLSNEETLDRGWVADVVGKGDQGTRSRYRDFPGVAELAKRIRPATPFARDSDAAPIEARIVIQHHSWVERCFIDVLPAKLTPGEIFEVGGVIVLSREAPAGLVLQLESSGQVVPVEWTLPSQRMAAEHPQGANSANARFRIRGVRFQEYEESLVLSLSGPNSERLVLAEVIRSAPPDYSQIYVEPGDRLIFDVGGNDGADTWYYLRKGFRVVVVEAIPELVERLRDTFSAQIAAGRLIVEPVAIAEHTGEVSFTINDEWTEWSSAHGAPKASLGSSRIISVPSTTLAALMARHGTPYYIKIDIEGGELAAVDSLREVSADKLPRLLSFEINPRFGEVLEHLYDLGYRRFQLVRQGATFFPRLPFPSLEGLDYRCAFTNKMSGPFGEDLPQSQWVGLVEIIQRILQSLADMQARKSRGEKPGWYDVHARLCK